MEQISLAGVSTAHCSKSLKSSLKRSQVDPLVPVVVIPPSPNCRSCVVLLCAFSSNFIADGTMYSSGLFLKPISKSFHTSATNVSLGVSILTGVYLLSGPLVCAVINRFGFRVTGMMGGLVSAFAIGLSSCLNDLIAFLITFGVLCGFGFSMTYVSSIMVVGFYFDRWRPIATSVAVCGSSTGMMVFPPVIKLVMTNLDWRTKYRILCALCCLSAIAAIAYRPLKPLRVVTEDKKVQFIQTAPTTTGSTESLESNEKLSITEEASGVLMDFFGKFNNVAFPSTADVVSVRESADLSTQSRPSNVSFMLCNISMSSSIANRIASKTQSRSILEGDRLSTLIEEETDTDKSHKKLRCSKIRETIKGCSCCRPKYDVLTATRPMYRDDIFYTGSIYTLSEYSAVTKTSRVSSKLSKKSATIDYHISVTRVATQKDLEEDYICCICCPVSMKRTLATMLELSLMKSPSFILILVSGFFTTLGMYTPFIYISQYAVQKNMALKLAVYLISAVGVSNCIGRLACGIISSLPHVGALRFSSFSLILCGSVTISSVFFNEMYSLFTFAALFGMSIAALPSLRSIILVEMFGIERLTNAFGLVMLFQGVACLLGLPISGALNDYTGTYDACFIFSGTTITFSGFMLIPVKLVAKWERKRQERKSEEAKLKKKVTIA